MNSETKQCSIPATNKKKQLFLDEIFVDIVRNELFCSKKKWKFDDYDDEGQLSQSFTIIASE